MPDTRSPSVYPFCLLDTIQKPEQAGIVLKTGNELGMSNAKASSLIFSARSTKKHPVSKPTDSGPVKGIGLSSGLLKTPIVAYFVSRVSDEPELLELLVVKENP